jgi:signal transduction histidine kinase
VRQTRRDGSIVPVLAAVALVTDAAGTPIGAVTVNHDITERQQLLEREQAARAAAEAAVRLRDEVLAAISHDLQNPLAVIRGQAQRLQRHLAGTGASDQETLRMGLGQIDALTRRMTALVDDLLDVAQLEAGQTLELARRRIDLVGLVQQTAAQHQPAAGQRLRVEAGVAVLVGYWDVARLERVVANLLSNAFKYSPPTSMVSVWVGREADVAVLRVADQGMGIPAADLPHIFARFHRGRNVTGRIPGSGLGLAGVRAIVEQHGGTITVASREGAGSTFTVRLPLGDAREPDGLPPSVS